MIRGGVADKLGNAYEALWTMAEALRVLQGLADEIRIEPFNEDARGLEFRVNSGGRTTWHQCKRRLGAGSWTIAALENAGVLDDFARKLVDPVTDCVFVSGDPAAPLKALSGKASIVDSSKAFLDSLANNERLDLQELGRIWRRDEATLFDWLRRLRVETVSDVSLKRALLSHCELLFRAPPETASERLAAILETRITHAITTTSLRADIEASDLGWQARFEPTLEARFAAATDDYLASLAPPIAGADVATPAVTELDDAVFSEKGAVTLLSGGAGGGKSRLLTHAISGARQRGWPVMALRVDRFLDARSLAEVGQMLVERDEHPVGMFGNWARGRDCLLVIDQVDAVSEASGRSGRIRDLLFQMIDAAKHYPGLRLVLACRSYDLENDSRLKALLSRPLTVAIRLPPLDWDTAVAPLIRSLGLREERFSKRQRDVLSVPINLQLFASLVAAGEVPAGELTGVRLFDRLLELRARDFRSAGVTWTPRTALGRLARWMSEKQVLTAPAGQLADLPGALDLLSSHGLVTKTGAVLQFAHESYFDHVFSADFRRSRRERPQSAAE